MVCTDTGNITCRAKVIRRSQRFCFHAWQDIFCCEKLHSFSPCPKERTPTGNVVFPNMDSIECLFILCLLDYDIEKKRSYIFQETIFSMKIDFATYKNNLLQENLLPQRGGVHELFNSTWVCKFSKEIDFPYVEKNKKASIRKDGLATLLQSVSKKKRDPLEM